MARKEESGNVVTIRAEDMTSPGAIRDAVMSNEFEPVGIGNLDGGQCAEQVTAHLWEALHDLYARPDIEDKRQVIVNLDVVCEKGIVAILWRSQLKRPPMTRRADTVLMQQGVFYVKKPEQRELEFPREGKS